MTYEQCKECKHFCIKRIEKMNQNYPVCTHPECMEKFNAPTGFLIEYIKRCPMGKYDPVGPGKIGILNPTDVAFGMNWHSNDTEDD